MATLEGIAYRTERLAPMQLLKECEVTLDAGVHSDSRGKPGHRQVTLLSAEAWADACADLDAEVSWTTRRANLLIRGLRFGPEDVGRRIRVGEALLEITGETIPCRRMDEQHDGLTGALTADWRGGACCRVIEAGRIRVGDSADFA
jgi:MOSC domain-containing protein YiiM